MPTTLSNDRIVTWVTRPERPKGAKDEVKRGPKGRKLEVGARRAPKLLVKNITYCTPLSGGRVNLAPRGVLICRYLVQRKYKKVQIWAEL